MLIEEEPSPAPKAARIPLVAVWFIGLVLIMVPVPLLPLPPEAPDAPIVPVIP